MSSLFLRHSPYMNSVDRLRHLPISSNLAGYELQIPVSLAVAICKSLWLTFSASQMMFFIGTSWKSHQCMPNFISTNNLGEFSCRFWIPCSVDLFYTISLFDIQLLWYSQTPPLASQSPKTVTSEFCPPGAHSLRVLSCSVVFFQRTNPRTVFHL